MLILFIVAHKLSVCHILEGEARNLPKKSSHAGDKRTYYGLFEDCKESPPNLSNAMEYQMRQMITF